MTMAIATINAANTTTSTGLTGTWANIHGEWAVRCSGGMEGDFVTVTAKNGRISKVQLGMMLDIGLFAVAGKKAPTKAFQKKPITQTTKLGFECITCNRCDGTGHHSYCTGYGTRCFKCCGNKVILTSRGAAAHGMYMRAMEVKYSEVKAGMKLRDEHPLTGVVTWHEVKEVEVNGTSYVIRCEKYGASGGADNTIRIARTAEEKAAFLKTALEYQATL
jgi:hypothetical protein